MGRVCIPRLKYTLQVKHFFIHASTIQWDDFLPHYGKGKAQVLLQGMHSISTAI